MPCRALDSTSAVSSIDAVAAAVRRAKDAAQAICRLEIVVAGLAGESVTLRVSVEKGAVCRFSYSEDGQAFTPVGQEFLARKGHRIGAKVGLFCIHPGLEAGGGFADFAWFRF